MAQFAGDDHILFADLRREKAGHSAKLTLQRVLELYLHSFREGSSKGVELSGTVKDEFERLCSLQTGANYYRVLGVRHDCKMDELKRKHRQLQRLLSSDRWALTQDPAVKRQVEAWLTAANSAFETLADPEARRRYDLEHQAEFNGAATTRSTGRRSGTSSRTARSENQRPKQEQEGKAAPAREESPPRSSHNNPRWNQTARRKKKLESEFRINYPLLIKRDGVRLLWLDATTYIHQEELAVLRKLANGDVLERFRQLGSGQSTREWELNSKVVAWTSTGGVFNRELMFCVAGYENGVLELDLEQVEMLEAYLSSDDAAV